MEKIALFILALVIIAGFIAFFGVLGKGILKDESKTNTPKGILRFIVIGIVTFFIWYQLAKASRCNRISEGYGDNPTETY